MIAPIAGSMQAAVKGDALMVGFVYSAPMAGSTKGSAKSGRCDDDSNGRTCFATVLADLPVTL